MPYTESFLSTCRTTISATAEYTAFQTALTNYTSSSASNRHRYWTAAYDNAQAGQSPAYRLHAAVRGAVTAQAAITGGISETERETAIRTLAAEYIPNIKRPLRDAEEQAALTSLLLQEQLS